MERITELKSYLVGDEKVDDGSSIRDMCRVNFEYVVNEIDTKSTATRRWTDQHDAVDAIVDGVEGSMRALSAEVLDFVQFFSAEEDECHEIILTV